MLKLPSLRALIEAAVPDLARDPERLIVLANGGRLAATGTASLSFEYRYTASITVLDYTGHTDALMVPLLAWIQVHQSELLANPETAPQAVRFRVEHLNTAAADIGIEIDLTERALVSKDPAHPTRLLVKHPDEPGHVATPQQREHWELWLRDQLLAEWDMQPPLARELFSL